MSKNALLKTLSIVCALILIAAAAVSLTGLFRAGGLTYAHAEKYTAGEAEITGTVRNLDIRWISGKVRIVSHDGSGLRLSETAKNAIPADQQLRWWLDGDTLRVQFAKSGLRIRNQSKELTLSLPEGIAFDTVNIDAISADLDLSTLQAADLNLNTTSGDIALQLSGDTNAVAVNSTSGSIRMEAERADKAKISSTSGEIAIAARQIGNCSVSSTSGNVSMGVSSSERVKIGSTSGDVRVVMDAVAALEVGCTSGAVTADLPVQPGFTAKLETASGRIENTLPLSRQGSAYVCGDGSGKVEIGTASGNIRLNAREKQ